jgi:hypothetical protein
VRVAVAGAAWLFAWAGAGGSASAPPGPEPSAAAPPAPPACQTFTRATADTPTIVRDWLARSSDDHVIVCAPTAAQSGAPEAPPSYSGESAVVKRGTLCSYSSHGLSREGSGARFRLQRYERGEAVGMTVTGGDCPAPHAADTAQRYTITYDVSPAAFESIMTFWSAVAASPEALDRAIAVRGGAAPAPGSALVAETDARLRAAIAGDRMRLAAVTRIVRTSGRSALRHRYSLFVSDPDSRPGSPSVYVIYLTKWPVGPYHIVAITTVAS